MQCSLQRILRFFLVISLCAIFGLPCAAETQKSPATAITFETHIRPILKANCFQCHGDEEEIEAGLDLRLGRLIAKGGDSGAAMVPGNRQQSLLFERVKQAEMPPGDQKLSKQEIELIGRWIDAGANVARPEPADIDSGFNISSEDRRFWAFQPIRRPDVPTIGDSQNVRAAIDTFVLARLEDQGLKFQVDADRQTLIRRAYFDLLGLPPTPDDVNRFVRDRSPAAYEKLLDRLLASPHYGERWGRNWLDVAGYADSEGYTNEDVPRKWAYKYRDYVIESLNADKPFDEFIREQLAGDEMVKPPYQNLPPGDLERLVATGFLRVAPDGSGQSGINENLARNQVVADTIKIVTTSLLGLSVGCAQCHNHRYDPIPQTDYYAFRAILEPGYDWKNWQRPAGRLVSLYTQADREESARVESQAKRIDERRSQQQQKYIDQTLDKELQKLPEEIRQPIRKARETPVAKRTPQQERLLKQYPSVNVSAGSLYLYDRKAADHLKQLSSQAAKVRARKPKEEFVRALTEVPGQVPKTHLFYRGDYEQPKQEVAPAGLKIWRATDSRREPAGLPIDDDSLPTTGRRLAYARKLTDGTHPLMARVIVNRIWMHHLGRGIVATPSDFGFLGARPSHPALLDWLADEFVAGGWGLKRLHKLIMTSTVYRQSSNRSRLDHQIDPDNRLLSHTSVRRLEAEVLRDSILTVSGKLNTKRFGPPVPVMPDRVGRYVIGIENLNAGRPGPVIPMKGEEFRRSVYVQVRRSRLLSALTAFDLPAMSPNCEVRNSSTVAPQSLMLMNSDFVLAQSEFFAARVRQEIAGDLQTQINFAWRLAYSRDPSNSEVQDAQRFIEEQSEVFESTQKRPEDVQGQGEDSSATARRKALASFCQALLSSNEFLYIQ